MWERIAGWSAQGVVQAAISVIVAGVGSMVWDLMDMETLAGITCLVVLFFCTFFGLKLLHLPNFKFPSQKEYDALKTLGKVNKRTLYFIEEEKEPREK